jgi:ribA/ribD-fused uncharacterized protein
MASVIDRFIGQYSFLSNFSPAPVVLDGLTYPTVEHAYQAAKFSSAAQRAKIRACQTPGRAKRLAATLPGIDPHWDAHKLLVMEGLLLQKFAPESTLLQLLVDTYPADLVEGNTWGDTFWGICEGQGQNHLGRLLTRIRDEARYCMGLDLVEVPGEQSAPLEHFIRPKPLVLAGKSVYAATGHRLDKLCPRNKDLAYSTQFLELLTQFAQRILQADRPDAAISGMALGWDTAWAIAAIRENIPLVAAVPCEGQQSRWPAQSQARYERILSKAWQVVVLAPEYSRTAMQDRNEWMVDSATRVIALWNGTPGGTRNCVDYAMKVARPLRNYWGKWAETLTTLQS